MEDNLSDLGLNVDKTTSYRVKLHKLLQHCMQEIAALSNGLTNAYIDEYSYQDLHKRIKALQQRQQFYQAQLAQCAVKAIA